MFSSPAPNAPPRFQRRPAPARRLPRPTLARGLTLVECCVALAISSTLASLAAPSFRDQIERHEVEAVAAQMRTEFAHARSLAVAQNRTVRIHFSSPRCYVVHGGGTATTCSCDAEGNASCAAPTDVLRVVQLAPNSAVTWQSNSASMAFDAAKGTVTPTGTVKIRSQSGLELRNVVNIMGRVRQCAATAGLAGYAGC